MLDSVFISVVAAMHNELENVQEFYRRVHDVLASLGRPYEILLIDDGSTDGTPAALREIARHDPAVKAILFSRNFGQWAAIYAGLQYSCGDWVVVMDSDLQHLPEEIPQLLQVALETNCDLVSGWRQRRRESAFTRRFPSMIANWAIRKATGCDVHDMGGFKCIRGVIARELQLFPGQHRFLPALVHIRGGCVQETPISAPPRLHGKSHYSISRAFDVFFDILSLRFQAQYRSRPLQLLGRIALALFLFGMVSMGVVLYDRFFRGIEMGTRPLFVLSVLGILLGMLCLLLGLITEMIAGIHYSIRDVKPYYVREVITTEIVEKEVVR